MHKHAPAENNEGRVCCVAGTKALVNGGTEESVCPSNLSFSVEDTQNNPS